MRLKALLGLVPALAMALGASAAHADRTALEFSWTGSCISGCPVGDRVTAVLDLNPDYVSGAAITNDNFDELIFRSTTLTQIIGSLDEPTIGVNSDGSLAGGSAISFQDGGKTFAFQVLSEGPNWTAAAPGFALRGFGDSKFSALGVQAVPEASTWALMAVGFGALGFLGVRRGKRGASGAAAHTEGA